MMTPRSVTVLRSLATAAIGAGLFAFGATHIAAQGGITITGCSGATCILKAGPDFATDTFSDAWDFQQRSDVAIDPAQVTGLANLTIGGGIVGGTALNSGSHFAVLEQPWGGIINPGKTGQKFPIASTHFTKLAVKFTVTDATRFPRVYWAHDVVGGPSGGFLYFDSGLPLPATTGIYVIDMTQAPAAGTPWTGGPNVQRLAFYPNSSDTSGADFRFDWVRLTTADANPAATNMTLSWSGGASSGDITVTDAAGTVYTVKKGVTSDGNFTWNYGILPPGNYTLKVGTTLSKTFTINTPPVIHVTEPDETGGADFATDVLHNAWDMSDTADVFHNVNIVPHVFGEAFTGGLYSAISDGVAVAMAGPVPVGDPQVYLLSNQKTSNTTDIIDTTKYHRLTFDMSVDRAFNLGLGSVARVFWGSAHSETLTGGTPYNVTTTKDVIMWPGKNTYSFDLATLTTANGLEVSNATPWTAAFVRHFRIDPHEFAEQVPFYMDNVKLAADDQTANNSFTIKWVGSDPDPGTTTTVSLYYQTGSGSPTLIASGLPLASGQYIWNTTFVPSGTYIIRAVADDGLNSTTQFSTGPVKVVTGSTPSNGLLSVDTPTPGATVTSAFEIFGWAVDLAAPSGTGIGVDDVMFYIYPNGGAEPGVLIGHGKIGFPRADVSATFGPQFANSGYHFTITGMGPGNFVLGVFARSTVTGTYSIVKMVPGTVSATGLMSIDVPSAEMEISSPTFGVSGWAIDRTVESTSQSGTGVDMVHVYAYPKPGVEDIPPIFLGVATMGLNRPDVAALYGSRYANSGYVLGVDRAVLGLTPDNYNIVTVAHSTVTGTFNNLAIVRVELK